MQEYARPLGDAVRDARVKAHRTQNEVASQTNLDVRTILNIENYHGNPKMMVLYPLVRALNVNPVSIFYPELETASPELQKLQFFLSSCSESEAAMLLPICRTILETYRASQK